MWTHRFLVSYSLFLSLCKSNTYKQKSVLLSKIFQTSRGFWRNLQPSLRSLSRCERSTPCNPNPIESSPPSFLPSPPASSATSPVGFSSNFSNHWGHRHDQTLHRETVQVPQLFSNLTRASTCSLPPSLVSTFLGLTYSISLLRSVMVWGFDG